MITALCLDEFREDFFFPDGSSGFLLQIRAAYPTARRHTQVIFTCHENSAFDTRPSRCCVSLTERLPVLV
jgi:hypothetical protein